MLWVEAPPPEFHRRSPGSEVLSSSSMGSQAVKEMGRAREGAFTSLPLLGAPACSARLPPASARGPPAPSLGGRSPAPALPPAGPAPPLAPAPAAPRSAAWFWPPGEEGSSASQLQGKCPGTRGQDRAPGWDIKIQRVHGQSQVSSATPVESISSTDPRHAWLDPPQSINDQDFPQAACVRAGEDGTPVSLRPDVVSLHQLPL